MKRSEINQAYRRAIRCFGKIGWALPPNPRWDITDCGLGRYAEIGLALVNLAEEPEYSEKIIYCWKKQGAPVHCHHLKKEDIICRWGELAIQLWTEDPAQNPPSREFRLKKNGTFITASPGEVLRLKPGERVTIEPRVWHAFWAESDECVVGEVSTANDDAHDNFFSDPNIGRFPKIEEDEPPLVRLVNES